VRPKRLIGVTGLSAKRRAPTVRVIGLGAVSIAAMALVFTCEGCPTHSHDKATYVWPP
jgi:hypothetical protein